MTRISYYDAEIIDFLATNATTVLGKLTENHSFALEHEQKYAWQEQIQILQRLLLPPIRGRIYFEFSIPRMGKRVDVIIVTKGVIFVIEFKVGAHSFDNYAIDQVHDYALDLKNFHRGSHGLPIVPILIPTKAPPRPVTAIQWAVDQVAEPLCISPADLLQAIQFALGQCSPKPIDVIAWSHSGYQPTPTIVEAALALYRQHDVKEITRSEAGADNLGVRAIAPLRHKPEHFGAEWIGG